MIELALPALVDRSDDILPLARHFLTIHAQGRSIALDMSAERALLDYEWPGNVRELENRIQRALIVTQSPSISAANLALPQVTGPSPRSLERESGTSFPTPVATRPTVDAQYECEREQVEQALVRAQGVYRVRRPSSALAVRHFTAAWSASA